ncbi:MAG TPA: hypothetical protein VGZ52_02170 [Acidimicrobiales bacterium]|nr:hypothetical protein [Acidimicrobiales bacterium]
MSRTLDDVPAIASDAELLEWSRGLAHTGEVTDVRDLADQKPARPNRPLFATRTRTSMSTQELFADIEERAAAAYRRSRVTARR